MSRWTPTGLFALFAAVTAAAGPGADADGPIVHDARSLSARANWEAADHPHYRYRLQRECYCAAPNDVVVQVADGRVVAVTDTQTGQPVDPAQWRGYRTVPELFAEIDDAVSRQPDSLLVEYHRTLGYPQRVRIDFSYRMADEEIDYAIASLEILPGADP